ncbi:MAG TPA: HDIG domain-containing metalloprotein [Candidatus Limnocylindrales bacterium]
MLKEPHAPPRAFGRRDGERLLLAAFFLVLVFAAGVAVDLAPSGPGYTVNSLAPTPIRAPRAATIPNPVETKQAQDAKAAGVLPQYDYSPDRASSTADLQSAELTLDVAPIDDAFSSTKAPEARQVELQTAFPLLTADARTTLKALDPSRWPIIKQAAQTMLVAAERQEIRDTDVASRRTELTAQYMPTGLSPAEQRLVAALASPLIVANSSFSATLTQQAKDQARQSVPPVQDTIQAGQVIVDQGHVIDAAAMVQIAYFGLDSARVDLGKPAAWMLLGVAISGMLLGWLWRYRPDYWNRGQTLVLIGLIFAVAVLAVKLAAGRATLPYLIPTAAAGMLLSVLLDAGAGMVMIALLAIVAGTVTGSSLELASYVFLGGFAGLLVVRKGERLHFFAQAGVAIAATDLVVVAVFTLLGQHDATGMLQLWAAAVGAAVIATVVTIGSFALLGNLFGILTGSQLMELANPSQPLLRRLLTETPGTYHHSLMVGNLAEPAATAIGADPLLTRVAAYYHDIGKLANPLVFIENQSNGENIHDELSAEDSAAILREHIAAGIDLAYKAKLPKPLIAFIPQHHGTATLSYFYAKAREAAAEPFGGLDTAAGAAAADAVDQRRFRHSGPKPQTREAAVLMLADGVEASVRSLSSRDEASIRAMVSQIIQERLADGQLNECDITIRDVELVREAFIGQLIGMYHQRIAYPQNKIVELESRRERGLG